MRWLATERGRAYLYRVLLAVLLLLVAYDVVAADDVPLWVGMVAALLGVGTATVNTSTRR